jgi:hypothetical protein
MATETPYLLLVLAAGADDYTDWCRATGRTPFDGSAWAISSGTGCVVTNRRTFQVTERWRERKGNRRILAGLHASGVPYGDEQGPWPDGRVPDLSWPTPWQRLLHRAA